MSTLKSFLHQALQKNGYTFSSGSEEKFLQFIELLQQWNRVFNLTAITEAEQIVLLHILDSLTVKDFLRGHFILDVGTGAGLPGIPLAIACPEKNFVLLDSNNKKTRFLIQAVSELQLKNVEVVHSRVEIFNPQNKFDTIVTRAFSSLKNICESVQHLLAENTIILAMKGIVPGTELNEISEDFKIKKVYKLEIKGLDANRCVVVISKGSSWAR